MRLDELGLAVVSKVGSVIDAVKSNFVLCLACASAGSALGAASPGFAFLLGVAAVAAAVFKLVRG